MAFGSGFFPSPKWPSRSYIFNYEPEVHFFLWLRSINWIYCILLVYLFISWYHFTVSLIIYSKMWVIMHNTILVNILQFFVWTFMFWRFTLLFTCFYVYMCMCVLCPQRLEEDVTFPGDGVICHCEWLNGWKRLGTKLVLCKNSKWAITPDPGFLF